MQIPAKKTTKFVFIISIVIITIIFITLYNKNNEKRSYTLKSYRNTIALYDDNEIIATYEDIVLNTLPESDIAAFNSGVIIESVAAAEKFLEDFDG